VPWGLGSCADADINIDTDTNTGTVRLRLQLGWWRDLRVVAGDRSLDSLRFRTTTVSRSVTVTGSVNLRSTTSITMTPLLTRSWLSVDGPGTPPPTTRNRVWSAGLLVVPILFAWYISAYLGRGPSADNIELVRIDISRVLKQNLALAKHSWEHGVLTHALLELQNPELTVFAGPGYGVSLRDHSPGAVLEAFPGAKLPMCGLHGRYDEWTSVKGLRYAASKIETARPTRRGRGEGEKWWLYRGEKGGSAADAASLGWAALLLERAGADDPRNPVAVGRNAYGEAVDEMVDFLFRGYEDGGNMRFVDVDADAVGSVHGARRGVGLAEGTSWAVSHRVDSPQLWADFVFMVPPFLAAYAVGRQDEKWLFEAVEQIRAYARVLAVKHDTEWDGLWRHIVTLPRELGEDVCCHDEGLWLTGNAWALAGVVRVLGVLERWRPNMSTRSTGSGGMSEDRRVSYRAELLGMGHQMLQALRYRAEHGLRRNILNNYLDRPRPPQIHDTSRSYEGDPAGTALVASSVYRLAQLGLLEDPTMLDWADEMYNAVAQQVDGNGFLTPVASVTGVPSRELVGHTSEAQSFAILMYAARRDCEKLGVCRKNKSRRGWF